MHIAPPENLYIDCPFIRLCSCESKRTAFEQPLIVTRPERYVFNSTETTFSDISATASAI